MVLRDARTEVAYGATKALKDPPQLDSRAKICVNKVWSYGVATRCAVLSEHVGTIRYTICRTESISVPFAVQCAVLTKPISSAFAMRGPVLTQHMPVPGDPADYAPAVLSGTNVNYAPAVEDACAMRVRIKKGLVIPNGTKVRY
eukprot:2304605-Rhodomonas_salina.4